MASMTPDVAATELDRFFDAMDLEFDTSTMDPEDAEDFEDNRKRLIKAITNGKLSIDDQGRPVFIGVDSEQIVFHPPTGASLMAMDDIRGDRNTHKLCAFMADITRTSKGTFSKMPLKDFKTCSVVANFLAEG